MKRLPNVATEMALHVFAYNLTRVMNIMGIRSVLTRPRPITDMRGSGFRYEYRYLSASDTARAVFGSQYPDH